VKRVTFIPMMTWKSLFLRIAKTAALIVPALLAVLALGFALLQTDMGKNTLMRLAATALSKEASRKVELRGLSGWIPFDFQLQGLSVSDEQGLWLNVDDVSVRWSPFALLGGRLSIHEMTARRVELLRTPQDQKEPRTKPPALPEWPGVLSKIQIERLAAERIVLGPALAGEPAVLSFEAKIGAAPFPAGEIQTLIRLEQIDRPGASLRIDALYKTKEQVLSIDGRFEEGRDGLAARLLGIEGPLAVSLSGGGPVRDLEAELRAQAGALSLDLAAALNPEEQTLEGRYTVLCHDLASLRSLAKADLKGRLKAHGQFSGPLYRPQSTHLIEIADAQWNDAGASRAEVSLDVALMENLGGPLFPRFKISGRGEVQAFVFQGLEKFLETTLSWEFFLQGPEKDGLHLSRFVLRSGENVLRLSGTIDPFEAKGALDVAFESHRPASLFEKAGLNVPWIGPTLVHASLEGDGQALSLKTRLRAKSTLLPQDLPEFVLVPEKEISYGADLSLHGDKILRASRLWAASGGATVEGQGSFDLSRDTLAMSWNAAFPDPARFLSLPNLSSKGPLTWSATAEGALSSLKLSTHVEALDLDVSGFLLERARAGLQATFTPTLKQGDLSLDLFQAKKWIKARSGFSLDGHLLHLSEISITGFESTLTGRATLDLETPEARGEIRGSLSDLSLLLALVGQELHGSAKGEAAFRLGPGDRDLALSLEASSLESPFGAARGLQLKTRLTGTADRMKGSVDLEIRDGRSGDGSIALLAFKAQGDTDLAEFQLHAKGRYGQDFDVKTSGAFTLSKEVQRLALKHFQARYGPESTALPLSLIKPTRVIYEKGALRVEETSFTLGTGSFRGAGTYAARHVDFDLDFKDLPLELLKVAGAPGLRGRASGTLALAGDPQQPEATFELLAVNLGLEEDYFPDLPDPSLDLKGSFSDRQVKADLVFRGLTPDPLKASVAFPSPFPLRPFHWSRIPGARWRSIFTGKFPCPTWPLFSALTTKSWGAGWRRI
jgi:autotransporter translocation and assembly factor TamB